MKVLYMATYSNMSGANRSMIGIIECVRNWGIEPFVIIPKHGPVEQELKDKNIKYRIIPSAIWVNPGDGLLQSIFKFPLKYILNICAERRIGNYIKNNDINLVHINTISNPAGSAYAIKHNIPLIWHIRELVEADHKWKFYNEKRTYEILNKASKVVAISKSVAKRFSPYLKNNLVTIYNGIKINKQYSKERWIFNDDKFEITCAGRILPEKGQMEAIKAVKILTQMEIHNISLNIYGEVGDRTYYQSILKYIEEQDLDRYVTIHGYCKNMDNVWFNTDIALVCSVAEAFGRVTVEAMIYGALVIGSNTAGTSELIENMKTGFLYEQGNPKDLAQKLKYAIDFQDESKQIAKNGQKYMLMNMTAEKNARAILKIYESVFN